MRILRGHVICATRVATGNSLAGSLLRRRSVGWRKGDRQERWRACVAWRGISLFPHSPEAHESITLDGCGGFVNTKTTCSCPSVCNMLIINGLAFN